MIGYDIDGGASSFEVVAPTFESVVDGCKFFVMNVVISLGAFESPGVELRLGRSRRPGFGWTIRQLVCSQRHQSLP